MIGRDVSDLMLEAYRREHLLSHLYGHDASGEMPEVPMAGRRSEARNLVTQASVQAGCRTDCLFVANMSRQVRCFTNNNSPEHGPSSHGCENDECIFVIAITSQALQAEGIAILFIEQNIRLALSMAGRGYILESGRLTIEGDAPNLINSPEVRRIFLGR